MFGIKIQGEWKVLGGSTVVQDIERISCPVKLEHYYSTCRCK